MSKIIVALDFSDSERALALVEQLEPSRCAVKVGKELFTRLGPAFVTRLVERGFKVFLDLKFHDIPNTVAGACAAAADLGVWMVNVHSLGGRRMMEAAREAIDKFSHKPLLIGVTILTSLGEEDLREVGLSGTPSDNVLHLAQLAAQSGLDGVVCSPRELVQLRKHLDEHFLLVTPGIRPLWAEAGDQKRVLGPAEAVAFGANYLVIGRPITEAANPVEALLHIEGELSSKDVENTYE